MTYCKIDNKILFYLKFIVNCFKDILNEKEFGNKSVSTADWITNTLAIKYGLTYFSSGSAGKQILGRHTSLQ